MGDPMGNLPYYEAPIKLLIALNMFWLQFSLSPNYVAATRMSMEVSD